MSTLSVTQVRTRQILRLPALCCQNFLASNRNPTIILTPVCRRGPHNQWEGNPMPPKPTHHPRNHPLPSNAHRVAPNTPTNPHPIATHPTPDSQPAATLNRKTLIFTSKTHNLHPGLPNSTKPTANPNNLIILLKNHRFPLANLIILLEIRFFSQNIPIIFEEIRTFPPLHFPAFQFSPTPNLPTYTSVGQSGRRSPCPPPRMLPPKTATPKLRT